MKKIVMTVAAVAAMTGTWAADTTVVPSEELTLPYSGTTLSTKGHLNYIETDAERGIISGTDSEILAWKHDHQNEWPHIRLFGDYETSAELTLRNVALTNRYVKLVVAAGGKDGDGNDLGGYGHLVLDHSFLTLEKCYLAYGKSLDENKAQSTRIPKAELELKNGSVFDATWLYMSDAVSDKDHVGAVTNRLVIGSDSEVRVGVDQYGRSLARFNDSACQVVFDGGSVNRKGSFGFVFTPGGWSSANAGAPYSVVNTEGHDLIVSTGGTNIHLYGRYMPSNPTRELFDLDLTGAICKRGWGTLHVDLAAGDTKDTASLVFNGYKVEQGVLAHGLDSGADSEPVHPVSISKDAALNLADGKLKAHFVDVEGGAGTVTAREATGSLIVGSDADETTGVELSGRLDLTKNGTGLFAAKALGLAASGVTVREGTLKLSQRDAAPGRGYRKYRFRVTEVIGTSNPIMELGELAVFAGENDVTKTATVFADWTTISTSADGNQVGKTFSFWNGKWESPENVVDGNLNTKSCDLRAPADAAWWIGLDFGEPTVLTGYKWADAGTDLRKPKSWVFEGSDDGVCWTVLGSVSNYEGQKQKNRAWVGSTEENPEGEIFPIDDPVHMVESLGAVSVALGATLDLSAMTSEVEVHPTRDLLGTIRMPETGRLTIVCDEDVSVDTAVFSATSATLVKAGPGELVMPSRLPSGIKTEVREGKITIRPTSFTGKYFRFTVKGIRDVANTGADKGKVMNLGKLHLYDAAGNVVNENLAWLGGNPTGSNANTDYKNSSDGTPAKELPEGTFSQAGQYRYSIWNGAHEAPYWIFYPASDTHKWCTTEHVFDREDPNAWYTINFRLRDAAAPVTSYNLRSVGNQYREVAAWSLEGSTDGVRWHVLDEKDIGTDAPSAANTWYNGGVAYPLDLSFLHDNVGFMIIIR